MILLDIHLSHKFTTLILFPDRNLSEKSSAQRDIWLCTLLAVHDNSTNDHYLNYWKENRSTLNSE